MKISSKEEFTILHCVPKLITVSAHSSKIEAIRISTVFKEMTVFLLIL